MTDDSTERVRAALAAESVREIRMFGGLSFMVDDRMVLNVRKSGDLLVRVDPERSPALVAEHGARRAEMGAGRTMGPGWLEVPADLAATEAGLAFWIDEAMRFHAQGPRR